MLQNYAHLNATNSKGKPFFLSFIAFDENFVKI